MQSWINILPTINCSFLDEIGFPVLMLMLCVTIAEMWLFCTAFLLLICGMDFPSVSREVFSCGASLEDHFGHRLRGLRSNRSFGDMFAW